MPVFKTGAINHSANSPANTVLLQSPDLAEKRKANLFRSVGIHQYLAGLARFQPGHGLGKILHRYSIRNHRMQIEPSTLQQSRHLIPGLVHAASVDALNGDS